MSPFTRLTRNERGTVTAFVVIMTLALVVMAGLVVDGGYTLAARRRAFNEADAAARAGAQALDEAALRSTGVVRLRPDLARTLAEEHLRDAGVSGEVEVTDTLVTVRVTTTQDMAMLGMVGVGALTIDAEGSARAVQAVREGEG
jgi:uncharacterized membrane protein